MAKAFQRSAAVLLTPLLVLQLGFASQEETSLGLRVLVVSGNATENIIDEVKADPLGIVVVDRYNLLIPGASVSFTAPLAGPGGAFQNGSNSVVTVTDRAGRAEAPPYRPNSVVGPYAIQVEVEFAGETATAIIPQLNVRSSGSSKLLITVLSILGAVGAGLALGGGGGGTSPGPTPTAMGATIDFGDASVNAPSP